jgi:hypothetical protein
MSEQTMGSGTDVRRVLDAVTFAPSGVNLDKMDLRWEIDGDCTEPRGWLIRLTFLRPDTLTGKVGRGSGRWEFIERGATESGVVKTCWLLLELLVRHELMEAFHYKEIRLFDPHRTVADLSVPDRRSLR